MKRIFNHLALSLSLLLSSLSLHSPVACAARTGHGANTGSNFSDSFGGHPFGLGVVIGEPTGLSAKYFLDRRHAIDAGLAYSFNNFIYIFADYLFHFPGALGSSSSFVTQLSPYVGIGGIFLGSTEGTRRDGKYFTSSGSSAGLGMRLPLGIEWKPAFPTLGVFVELVPGLGLIPSTFGFIEGGIGIRYYF